MSNFLYWILINPNDNSYHYINTNVNNQMENKLSANEWMKTILDNNKKLKWTTTPLDKELLKPFHSKTSAIKVIDGSRNPTTRQLFERIRQRDDNVILLLQLLPINTNMFFKIN